MDINRPAYVIVFTALITAVFTAVVMTVQVATADKISRNEELRYEKAIVEVFGLANTNELSDEQIAQIVREQVQVKDGQRVRDPQSGRAASA